MEFTLRQRGRAAMDFMVSLNGAAKPLGRRWAADLDAAGVVAENLPDDLDARARLMAERLAGSRAFAVATLIADFASAEHGRVATDAFDECADRLLPHLAALEAAGPASITTHPGFEPPAYHRDVWFHRTTGGWDGHPAMGFIHGELIHRHYVARLFGGDIFAQRARVLAELPRTDYAHILEMGTSSGYFTRALQTTFPAAAITGIDLSLSMLRQALRVANANGWAWDLHQAAAEATPFADAAFDLVAGYIMFHEMPAAAIAAAWQEAFRVVAPGGQALFADVIPYAAQDKLAVWRADWQAARGGEPYWREAASADWAAMARAAGFVDVRAGGIDGAPYPHVVVATRPHG